MDRFRDFAQTLLMERRTARKPGDDGQTPPAGSGGDSAVGWRERIPRWSWRLNYFWLAVTVILMAPPLLYYAHGVTRDWLTGELATRSRHTLELYVSGLEGMLAKYQPLPTLHSLHPAILDLLENPTDPARAAAVNRLLEWKNELSGAADTYVMDMDGLTLAASNWRRPLSFVGKSFDFRPYFTEAKDGRLGRFYALGTTSKQRGYYFAAPVRHAKGTVKGVLVVKVDVTTAEQDWGGKNHEVMVTDQGGVIFMSSRPDWLYNAIRKPTAEFLADLGQTRRYADKRIERLAAEMFDMPEPWSSGFRVRSAKPKSYYALTRDMPETGWTVWLLADTRPVNANAAAYTAAIATALLLIAALSVGVIERRHNLLRTLAIQRRARRALEASAEELERRVEERTMDLKRTQNELVQAAKMAALGEMSAGISHELNQPLTAVRSYTDNARKFLDQKNFQKVDENLGLITDLSARMGDIIRLLKVFARQTSDELDAVSLQTVISDTLKLMNVRFEREAITLTSDIPAEPITVSANAVRLQQVLINLLSNSVDALSGQDDRRIHMGVSVDGNGDFVTLSVGDNGPGIPDTIRDRIFNPFFTTKAMGQGLGLGLSISYGIIQEFGSELTLRDNEGGGALFEFALRRGHEALDGIAAQ